MDLDDGHPPRLFVQVDAVDDRLGVVRLENSASSASPALTASSLPSRISELSTAMRSSVISVRVGDYAPVFPSTVARPRGLGARDGVLCSARRRGTAA